MHQQGQMWSDDGRWYGDVDSDMSW